MPYCEACGAFGEGAFCKNCGKPFGSPQAISQPVPSQPSPASPVPQPSFTQPQAPPPMMQQQAPPPVMHQPPTQVVQQQAPPTVIYQPPPTVIYQLPPPPVQQEAPPKQHRSKAKTIAIVIVGIVVLIVVVAVVLYLFLPLAGVDTGSDLLGPKTGTLQVRYNSVWGGDIQIYIDGLNQGVYSSDEFHTFREVSPGSHVVEARDLSGNYLDATTVVITAGETSTVELSY